MTPARLAEIRAMLAKRDSVAKFVGYSDREACEAIRELLAALEEAEQFGRLSAIAINQLSADLENMSGRKVLMGDPLPDKID